MNQFERAFTPEAMAEAWEIFQRDFPQGLWDTVYVTFVATFFAIVIGLPLGVLLVTLEPSPSWPKSFWPHVQREPSVLMAAA